MALDFFAGCLGGIAGVVVGHPLDTVKVNLQAQDPRYPKYNGTIHCIRSLVAKEGIRGIYRGLSSPIAGTAGINAIVFGVYGNTQKNLSKPDSLSSHVIAGAAAGLFQSFISSPIELAKSRQQVSNNASQNPFKCLKKIFKNEGTKGIFRGLSMTMLRDIPAFATYFGVYEMLTRNDDEKSSTTSEILYAGGLAGIACWIVSYPADVVKTRLQIDEGSGKYQGASDCFKKSVSSEGYRCLFKGLAPTLVRSFPVNAVIFTVVQWTMHLFEEDNSQPVIRKKESHTYKFHNFPLSTCLTEDIQL